MQNNSVFLTETKPQSVEVKVKTGRESRKFYVVGKNSGDVIKTILDSFSCPSDKQNNWGIDSCPTPVAGSPKKRGRKPKNRVVENSEEVVAA